MAARVQHEFNQYGYSHFGEGRNLWDMVVARYPPATIDDVIKAKAEELRAVGGTFVRGARDISGLALMAIQLGI